MFTECKPSHRESTGQLGAGSRQSLTVAWGKWGVMTLPCISPLRPSNFKSEAGGQGRGSSERVQRGGAPPPPTAHKRLKRQDG